MRQLFNYKNSVVITDPAIKVENGYQTYEDGLKKDVFMRGPDGNVIVNKVWPGLTVFPVCTNCTW